MSGKLCRAPVDNEADESEHTTASLATVLQVRVGMHTYLPVSERLKVIVDRLEAPYKYAEVASGEVCLQSKSLGDTIA